jgi:hypothetical protein
MSRENTMALVRYRLDQADDAVRAAQVLLDQQSDPASCRTVRRR